MQIQIRAKGGIAMTNAALIGAKEVAHQLGISLRKFEGMVADGVAPKFIRLGRLRRWRVSDIEKWVEERFSHQGADEGK